MRWLSGRYADDGPVTLLFTDLVGFSSFNLDVGDDLAMQLIKQATQAVEQPISAHRGRVVKRMGDGVMAVFREPQPAYDAVQEARVRLARIEVAGHTPRLRAALHTGRPKSVRGDYLGVDVNIAARLAQKAAPDEVLMSDVAFAGIDPEQVHARRKKTFMFTAVKGVPPNLVVYAVSPL
jgi:adenylate cyclase